MALALVAGCGGGSNDDQDYTPPPAAKITGAEGFWTGRSSTGYDVAVAVLDDGATWGLYSRDGALQGAVHGTTLSSDGRLRGSGAEFDLAANRVASRAYEGTYTRQKDISVWFGFDAFSGTYSKAYEQPASLAQLAGIYEGMGIGTGSGQTAMTLAISPDGAIAAEPSPGCTARGSAAPRPGGKNVFDLRLTFAGNACSLGHGAIVTGVAYQEDGKLVGMGVVPGQTSGFFFIASKPVAPPPAPSPAPSPSPAPGLSSGTLTASITKGSQRATGTYQFNDLRRPTSQEDFCSPTYLRSAKVMRAVAQAGENAGPQGHLIGEDPVFQTQGEYLCTFAGNTGSVVEGYPNLTSRTGIIEFTFRFN